MKVVRIPPGDKRILKPLAEAWQMPDSQDVPTEDIITWLRQNLHRTDIGLWVILDSGEIQGALLAFGPDLLQPQVHIYLAWIKRGCKVNAKEFFDGELTQWAKQMGVKDILMCSSDHSARAWQRRYGFVPYTRTYIKRLETNDYKLLTAQEKLEDVLGE